MSVLQNNINTYQTNTDYVNDVSKDFPNISYIQGSDEVKWNKYDPDHIVAVYNVTSTSEATKLLDTNSSITYQIIDGVQQQSVQTTYTFDTLGEHTVKYKINNTAINSSLFTNCTNLTGLTIPYGITYINSSLCYGCTGLTSVKLPDTLIKCNKQTFDRCTSLPVENGVRYADFCATGVANNNLTTYTLKTGTKFLLRTFLQCENVTSFDIPNGVIQIAGAFEGCSGLTSVTIPNSVTTIGYSAFDGCTGLTNVTIPDSVTSIGDYAFDSCEKLSNITILATTPPTVNLGYSIPTYYVFVPSDSVDTYKAANGWKSYPNIIYSLPVLKGEYLTGTIQMPKNKSNKLERIFYKSYPKYFEKLYINDIEVSTDYMLEARTSYTFKFELFDKRLIGRRLFADNYNFVTSIAIPDSVTSISNEAFYNCTILTSITIPNSVTSIGNYAFQSTSLTEIIIPDSVTSIGHNILNYNNKITNITILATTPPTLKSDTISGSNNCPIYVPAESVETYKAATNWSSLASRIKPIS